MEARPNLILILIIFSLLIISLVNAQDVIRLPPSLDNVDQISPAPERGSYLHEDLVYSHDYVDLTYSDQIYSDRTYEQLNSSCLESSQNTIDVDSITCPELNNKAQITFYDSTYTNINRVKVFRNGRFDADSTKLLSLIGNDDWSFNVSSFSEYEISDTNFTGTNNKTTYIPTNGFMAKSWIPEVIIFSEKNETNASDHISEKQFTKTLSKHSKIGNISWIAFGGYNDSNGYYDFNGSTGINLSSSSSLFEPENFSILFTFNLSDSTDGVNYTIFDTYSNGAPDPSIEFGIKLYISNRSFEAGNPNNTLYIVLDNASDGGRATYSTEINNLIDTNYLWYIAYDNGTDIINYKRYEPNSVGKLTNSINGTISNTLVNLSGIIASTTTGTIGSTGNVVEEFFNGSIEYFSYGKNYVEDDKYIKEMMVNFQDHPIFYDEATYESQVFNVTDIDVNSSTAVWNGTSYGGGYYNENTSFEDLGVILMRIEARAGNCSNISSENYIRPDNVQYAYGSSSFSFRIVNSTMIGECYQEKIYFDKDNGSAVDNSFVFTSYNISGHKYAPTLLDAPTIFPANNESSVNVSSGYNINFSNLLTFQDTDPTNWSAVLYYSDNDTAISIQANIELNVTANYSRLINSSLVPKVNVSIYALGLSTVTNGVSQTSVQSNNITIVDAEPDSVPAPATGGGGGGGAGTINVTEDNLTIDDSEIDILSDDFSIIDKINNAIQTSKEKVSSFFEQVIDFVKKYWYLILIPIVVLTAYLYNRKQNKRGSVEVI